MFWLKNFSTTFQSPEQSKQTQIIGISILSEGCGEKIVYIDVKKEEGQDESLRIAVSQTPIPASLAVTGDEGKVSLSDKLQDHPGHVLNREKSQQFAGEAAVPDSVIGCCQVDKHATGLRLTLKRILDILPEQNSLVYG